MKSHRSVLEEEVELDLCGPAGRTQTNGEIIRRQISVISRETLFILGNFWEWAGRGRMVDSEALGVIAKCVGVSQGGLADV